MEPSDREILRRVLQGERDLFRLIVERHGKPIWSTLRSRLPRAEDARELFQETWCVALEKLETLRDPARLRGWLVTIALNALRQRARRPVAWEPLVAQDESGIDASPGDALEADEERELLRRAIGALPERQREVVELRVQHGLSHAEIAATLGIRTDAARASFHQALRKLRERLDP